MTATQTQTQTLDRPGGRIAYDVRGDWPLVVCVPGMGELRPPPAPVTPSAQEQLPQVTGKPALIVMGAKDPDFPDPRAEAERSRGKLDAGLLLVPGAGHYPQAEMPDAVNPALVRFCQEAAAGA